MSGELSNGCRRSEARHRNANLTSEGNGLRETFNFEQLFGYYPPKLIIQDGDLCPEQSISVSGLERSKMSSLPLTHPLWDWTMGQPINKALHPVLKQAGENKVEC
jgi:hypothetical protein